MQIFKIYHDVFTVQHFPCGIITWRSWHCAILHHVHGSLKQCQALFLQMTYPNFSCQLEFEHKTVAKYNNFFEGCIDLKGNKEPRKFCLGATAHRTISTQCHTKWEMLVLGINGKLHIVECDGNGSQTAIFEFVNLC